MDKFETWKSKCGIELNQWEFGALIADETHLIIDNIEHTLCLLIEKFA